MDRIIELERAFSTFSAASRDLEASYAVLEKRVAKLTGALGEANRESRRQRRDKARLARRLSLLMDALPGAVLLLDAAGCVREANPAAEQIFGQALEGQAWPEISDRCVKTMNRSGEFVTHDGRRLALARRSLRPESGQILLFTDVTEGRAVDDLMERHQRLSTMGEMAAALAHQIRTPLSSALLYASSACAPRLTEQTRQKLAERVVARLHDLERLVTDMLNFAGGCTPTEDGIPIKGLLDAVHRSVAPQLVGAQRLQIQGSDTIPQVAGNEQAVAGALSNLVINGLEAAGNDAIVSIRAQVRDPGSVDLIVSDNGPGVAQGLEEKIFDPFFTTRANGTGLGLAVVRSVARSHQGDAWLERHADGRSDFVVRLPAQSSPYATGLVNKLPEVAA
ncbi:MAG: ATP-binding protein [Gammaproteobacteria bacterium]